MVSRSLGDAISLLVQPLTAQFVNSIVNTVLEVIADEMKLLAAARRPRAVKATRTTEAVKATKKSDGAMRCKFVSADGKRCKERSRGPRFHYLCKTHETKAKPAKPVKVKPAKTKPAKAETKTISKTKAKA
jgi:hypothetical protein